MRTKLIPRTDSIGTVIPDAYTVINMATNEPVARIEPNPWWKGYIIQDIKSNFHRFAKTLHQAHGQAVRIAHRQPLGYRRPPMPKLHKRRKVKRG